MTREIIEDFRFIVIPYMVNRLKEINYEGQGGSDAKEFMSNFNEICDMAIKALEQEPRKGEWLRMSDLSEQEDDRYKCSCCGNVVHYTNKINLYTFNNWCGRCGSDNGIHINCEVEE